MMLRPVGSSVVLFQSVEVPLDLLRRATHGERVLIESGDLLQPLDIEQGELQMAMRRSRMAMATA
jgi:hypothetical protein